MSIFKQHLYGTSRFLNKVAIHPFQDGNGRTGRIVNLLYLVQRGLLPQPVLYLSKYIIVNKTDYYYNLAGVARCMEALDTLYARCGTKYCNYV